MLFVCWQGSAVDQAQAQVGGLVGCLGWLGHIASLKISDWAFVSTSNMTGQSALVFGATGAVGKEILKELLASPDVVRVGEYGRRSVTCSRHLLSAHRAYIQGDAVGQD